MEMSVGTKRKICLGEKIKINHHLVRSKQRRPTENGWSRPYREWVKRSFLSEREVVVVGIRTLHNGSIMNDTDAGNIFTSEESFKAYLVVDSLNRKPFYTKIE